MQNIGQSRRRQAIHDELGLTTEREMLDIEYSLKREEERHDDKVMRMEEIEFSSSYMTISSIAKWMDKYYLDAILGLVPGGILDFLTSLFVLPFIYVSLFKVRSIPLTLAVIYNQLVDFLVGVIPFIGWLLDAVHKSNMKNFRLITGFVEDDKAIIREVNKKAVWMALGIVVVTVLICVVLSFVVSLF